MGGGTNFTTKKTFKLFFHKNFFTKIFLCHEKQICPLKKNSVEERKSLQKAKIYKNFCKEKSYVRKTVKKFFVKKNL